MPGVFILFWAGMPALIGGALGVVDRCGSLGGLGAICILAAPDKEGTGMAFGRRVKIWASPFLYITLSDLGPSC